jgi:hypothetical protein
MDDSRKTGSKAGEAKAPKKKAEDNPWYLLATLYGVPEPKNLELFAKNRGVWNHCLSTFLYVHERDSLIKNGKYTEAELVPCYPISWETELADAFRHRVDNEAQTQALGGFLEAAKNTVPDIDFSNAEFNCDVCFDGYLFTVPVFFNKTRFSEFAGFQNANFFKYARFNGASFKAAHFDNAHFWGASFQAATFAKGAVFTKATFSAPGAHFEKTRFRCADFSKANFFTGAYFNDSKMKGKTSFEGVKFLAEPSEFFNAKLHQGTLWRGITWPPPPKNKDEAGRFIDAYACLKLEMDRLKKHEDELDFFALELQSRRVLLGRWGWGLPIWLYGILSDYGRGYVRPLVALFVIAAIGAGAFWSFDGRTFGEALGLSAANTLNVFGFRRDFNLSIETPFAWLKILAAVQTILGTILLFLFGLGIRNKFRMK